MKEGLRSFILYDVRDDRAIDRDHSRERLLERRDRERATGRDVHSWRLFEMVECEGRSEP